MGQVYQNDANIERLRLEEGWREKRRRAFARFVMMPLSMGIIAAFAGVVLHVFYARIAGAAASDHAAMYVGAASAAAAAIGLIANVVSSRISG